MEEEVGGVVKCKDMNGDMKLKGENYEENFEFFFVIIFLE